MTCPGLDIGCGTGACKNRDQLEVVMDLESEHGAGGVELSFGSEDNSCAASSSGSPLAPPRKVLDSFPNARTPGALNLQELLQSPEAAGAVSPSDDECSYLWGETQDHVLTQPAQPSRPAKVSTVWKEQPGPMPALSSPAGRARTSSSIRTGGPHHAHNGMDETRTSRSADRNGHHAGSSFAPIGAVPGPGSTSGLSGQFTNSSSSAAADTENRRYCPKAAERCLWRFAQSANKCTKVLDRWLGAQLMPFCQASRQRIRVGLCALVLLLLGFTTLLGALLVDISLVAPPHPSWHVWPDVKVHGRDVSSTRAVEVMLRLRHADVAVIAQFELALFYEMHGTPPFSEREWAKAFWEAAALEQRLRGLHGWQQLCEQADPLDRDFCGPGASLPSVAVPSLHWTDEALMPASLSFDGGGAGALSLEAAVDFARLHGQDAVVLPTWLLANVSNLPYLRSFRTLFHFPLVVCQASDPVSVQHEMLQQKKDAWQQFVDEELASKLQLVVESQGLPFSVWYAGTNLEEAQLFDAVEEDSRRLLPPTFGLMWLCHTLYSSSFMLGTVSAVVLAICAYLALVISPEVGAASLLLTFFVAGIGSDMIFSCLDLWVSAESGTENQVHRLKGTYLAVCRYPLSIVLLISFAAIAAEVSAFTPLTRQAHQLMTFAWILWLALLLVIIPACELHDAARWKVFVRLRGATRRVLHNIIGGVIFDDKTWRNIWDEPRTRLAKWEVNSRWLSFDFAMFIFTFLLLAAITLTSVASSIAEANGVAEELVADDHNLMRSSTASQTFSNSLQPGDFTTLPPEMDLCALEALGTDPNCSLLWCYLEDEQVLDMEMPTLFDGACACQRSEYCDAGSERVAKMTVVEPLSNDMLTEDEIHHLLLQRWQGSATFNGEAHVGTSLHMLLSDWQEGISSLGRATTANISTGTPCTDGQRSVSDICYCSGAPICSRPDGYGWMVGLSPDDVSQALATANDSSSVVEYDQSDPGITEERWRSTWPWTVQVVQGFEHLSSGGSLLGNPAFATFEPESLDAQRALLRLCMDMPPELLVTSRSCWVEDFRDWLYLLGAQYRYPTFEEEFHDLALQYLVNVSSDGVNYVWIRDGNVAAYYLDFEVGLPQNATLEEIRANQAAWNRYLQEWIEGVPVEDGVRDKVGNVWATSELWVSALSGQYTAGDHTTSSPSWGGNAAVAVIFLSLVSVVAAQELVLGFGIVLSALIVICSLALMLHEEADRALGMVEVVWISLAFLHCSSACLHAAGQQGNSKDLTVAAKLPCGWSLAGSACTSLVCLIPFSTCELPIFTLGNTVVIFVVILSLVMALGPILFLRVAIAASSSARQRSPAGEKRHLVASGTGERRFGTETHGERPADAERPLSSAVPRSTAGAPSATSADAIAGDRPPATEQDRHTSQSGSSELGSTAAPERLGSDMQPPASGAAAPLPQEVRL